MPVCGSSTHCRGGLPGCHTAGHAQRAVLLASCHVFEPAAHAFCFSVLALGRCSGSTSEGTAYQTFCSQLLFVELRVITIFVMLPVLVQKCRQQTAAADMQIKIQEALSVSPMAPSRIAMTS